jgi:type I restriction enzyme, S subunit
MGGSLRRLKYLVAINSRSLTEQTPRDLGFRYLDIGAVGRGALVAEPEVTTFGNAPSRARRLVTGGDTIVSTVRTYLRAVWPVRGDIDGLVVSTGFVVLSPGPLLDSRYLGWVAQSDLVIEEVVARSVGVSYPGINGLEIGDIRIPFPPLSEQRSIADYIDAETARIDATVNARGRLVGLLRERRRVLVTILTTQGLAGLDAPRPLTSWPPFDLPSGWSLEQIRHLARVGRGASPRPIDDPIYFDPDGRYGWVRISDVTASGRYLEVTEDRLSEVGASKSVKLEPGALILSIAASVGNPIITRVPCCIHDGFVYFTGLRALEPEFLYYVLLGGGMFGGLGKLGTQLNLNTDTIGDIHVPVPPRDEQVEIVAVLDQRLAEIDLAIAAAGHQVNLLLERRQALIAAAVTGQLEIPGVAA